MTGLRAIMSSRLRSFLFKSCSVFFSLSGTRRSLDCMSLMTSWSSASDGKTRWHTGQHGSPSSVSWLMNWVYTAVAPASIADEKNEKEIKIQTERVVEMVHNNLIKQNLTKKTFQVNECAFLIKIWPHWSSMAYLSAWSSSPDHPAVCSGRTQSPDYHTHWRVSPRSWTTAALCVESQLYSDSCFALWMPAPY